VLLKLINEARKKRRITKRNEKRRNEKKDNRKE